LQASALGFSSYRQDPWNWVEWISFAAYFIGLLCQHSDDDEVYEAARILRSFSFMAFAYQIIRFGSMFETFGVLIPVLQKMVCRLLGSTIVSNEQILN